MGMKNIEKLRSNVLTLVEAKYMTDEIEQMEVDVEALQGALKMTHSANRLETAQLLETHAKREKSSAFIRLAYATLLRRICEWESATGEKHGDLMKATPSLRAMPIEGEAE